MEDANAPRAVFDSVAEAALDRLFRHARSQNGWSPRPVPVETLREIYELVRWGPTSANSSPARFLFLCTTSAKERLRRHLDASNVVKAMTAPVVAVIGFDTHFYDRLPQLFPHNPAARDWFAGAGKEAHAHATAFRNGSLQAGYFILAARALGLDCGPMSGFDHAGVDGEFWQGTHVRTNFLCALGHGDPARVFGRHPRLSFDEACRIE